MKLTFLGAAQTVTGSKYLVEHEERLILVDCGLFQGLKALREKNWTSLDIPADRIHCVLLTHAHIDHSGYIPRLVKDGFRGKIICTEATFELAKILLPDSAYIMAEEAQYANRKGFSKHHPALPLFTIEDVEDALKLFVTVPYEQKMPIGEHLTATFLDAGHILGSSSILLKDQKSGKSIGFSGDLGRAKDPILKPPSHFKDINYLVLESTYGDRNHDQTNPLDELAGIINDTYNRGGSLIIPAFAVGRTQTLLYYLSILLKQNRIPPIPIFLNSPMASKVSNTYLRLRKDHELSDDECIDMFKAAEFVKSPEASIALNQRPSPMIIISASGMATGGRVLHHLRRFLPDPTSTILFSGFQAAGTRGAKIMEGASTIKIHGAEWPVRAKVINLNSISAHADQSEIMQWLKESEINPRKVFVTHGEPHATSKLAELVENTFHWTCIQPKLGESYTL